MSSFRYVHRAALAIASLREREASRGFARARDRRSRAADTCARLDANAATLRADASRALGASCAPPLRTMWLVAGERALAAVALRLGDAREALAASDARLALARAELATCARTRDAFERHRAAALAAHALARERAEEAACDEAAALAHGARTRSAGRPGA